MAKSIWSAGPESGQKRSSSPGASARIAADQAAASAGSSAYRMVIKTPTSDHQNSPEAVVLEAAHVCSCITSNICHASVLREIYLKFLLRNRRSHVTFCPQI